jgi:hypothetical protein
MKLYFQHVDESDETLFGTVTYLDYIDDTDPSMILYVFDDGTRCNQDLVAPINTSEPQLTFAMVQVESPSTAFVFAKNDNLGEPVIKTKDANNNEAFIYNPNFYDANGNPKKVRKMRIEKPAKTTHKRFDDITDYYVSRIQDYIENGDPINPEININKLPDYLKTKNILQTKTITTQEIDKSTEPKIDETKSLSTTTDNASYDNIVVNVVNDDVINKDLNIHFKDNKSKLIVALDNGNVSTLTFDNGTETKEFTDEEFIEQLGYEKPKFGKLNVENADKSVVTLVNGMIDQSDKEESDINLVLGLEIPPKALFDVIKKVYKEQHTKQFVTTIANRIPDDVLRQAIADGLYAYYGGNENE